MPVTGWCWQVKAWQLLSEYQQLLLRLQYWQEEAQFQSLSHRQFWQSSFHDHMIRNEKDFTNQLAYIHFNPEKHGITHDFSKFPYSSYVNYQDIIDDSVAFARIIHKLHDKGIVKADALRFSKMRDSYGQALDAGKIKLTSNGLRLLLQF